MIVHGDMQPLGLVSSIGIRNLAGVPLVAVPFSYLPDLLSISRALSIMQLSALAFLGFFIGNRSSERIFSICVLIFFPGIILCSFSLWNQYIILPTASIILGILLFLLKGTGGGKLRAFAVSAVTALLLFQPAIHLMGFADLAAGFILLSGVMAFRPKPFCIPTAIVCFLLISTGAILLYMPWVIDTIRRLRSSYQLICCLGVVMPVLVAAGIFTIKYGPRKILDDILVKSGKSQILSWVIAALFLSCIAICAISSFPGAQPGRRLLATEEPVDLSVFAAQVMIVLVFSPSILILTRKCLKGAACRDIILQTFPSHAPAAILILSNAALLLAGRIMLEQTMILPFGRCDLIVSLVPVLLAPLILFIQEPSQKLQSKACIVSQIISVSILFFFTLAGPSEVFRSKYPHFVPPSEMQKAVDYIADLHKTKSKERIIDLGYDLLSGREWIPELVTRFQGFRWYSIGRPYDWLLMRRHNLVNAHEGAVDRNGGLNFQIGYLGENNQPDIMHVLKRLDHIEIRQRN